MTISNIIIICIAAFFILRIPLNYLFGKRLGMYVVTIRGKNHTWEFETWVDDQYLEEWESDGVKIEKICNTIPEIVVDLGLTRFWVWMQDHYIIPIGR